MSSYLTPKALEQLMIPPVCRRRLIYSFSKHQSWFWTRIPAGNEQVAWIGMILVNMRLHVVSRPILCTIWFQGNQAL